MPLKAEQMNATPRMRANADPVELVIYLRRILGPSVTSVIAGVPAGKDVDDLASGIRQPTPEITQRLQVAADITDMLLQVEAADTIQAWFVGKNQVLGDRAPAIIVGEDPEAVLGAAHAFVAYG